MTFKLDLIKEVIKTDVTLQQSVAQNHCNQQNYCTKNERFLLLRVVNSVISTTLGKTYLFINTLR